MAAATGQADPTDAQPSIVALVERSIREGGAGPAFGFVDFVTDPGGRRLGLSWERLGTRVRAVAAQLQQITQPGDRVAVLTPQGLDYVVGFLAAVHAGLIAVPLFPPDQPGHTDRVNAVLADCVPTVVLTTTAAAPGVRDLLRRLDEERGPDGARPRTVAVDSVPDALADAWQDPGSAPDDIAYLQYTSGSTRHPAGVVVTHRAATANIEQICRAYDIAPGRSAGVSWLPLFHDMGLVFFVLLPATTGVPVTIMDPLAFVHRPVRWLRLLAEAPGTFSAAPDFSYRHCVRRIKLADVVDLRLDGVRTLINGAEPVRASTITDFHDAFGALGLASGVQRPSYGLAEATVFVAASSAVPTAPTACRAGITYTSFDRARLNEGSAVPTDPGYEGGSTLVSCGDGLGQEIAVVDPATRLRRPDSEVGELWVRGPNLGRGYWDRPEESAEVFGGHLAGPDGSDENSSDEDPEHGSWLRTGDLAVRHGGHLYITGRLKDLIIVDGRNHYPQDIEITTSEAHPAVRPGCVAAFAVPGETAGEELVVVADRVGGEAGAADPDEVAGAVRRAVAGQHGVAVREVLLLPTGTVPKTSSGKIARRACRQRYLDGTLGRREVVRAPA